MQDVKLQKLYKKLTVGWNNQEKEQQLKQKCLFGCSRGFLSAADNRRSHEELHFKPSTLEMTTCFPQLFFFF